jgi:hypothetical protein
MTANLTATQATAELTSRYGIDPAYAARAVETATTYGHKAHPVANGIVDIRWDGNFLTVDHANTVAAGTAKRTGLPVNTPTGRRSGRRTAELIAMAKADADREIDIETARVADVLGTDAETAAAIIADTVATGAASREVSQLPAPSLHAECTSCGFTFTTPQRKATCNVKAACDKRAGRRAV